MAIYIPDSNSKRWVIISPTRQHRPDDSTTNEHRCPFCEGHEADTPPEVDRLGGGSANTPGWKIRVVPNKYQITDIHEVIIHSPNHEKDIADLSLTEVEEIFHMYRKRWQFHKAHGRVMIFSNHGNQAGASLDHPHSQLVVLTQEISLDLLSKEPMNNIVLEKNSLVAYCPTFSQWPYEVWIGEKNDSQKSFLELSDQEINDLAETTQILLKKLISKMTKMDNQLKTDKLSYNYYISPMSPWYLRIIPRTITRAGFELGTGLSVNIVDPKEAADQLR